MMKKGSNCQKKKGEKNMYDIQSYYDALSQTQQTKQLMMLPTGMLYAVSIISLIVGIISIVAMWKIFTKAGEAGWKSIIPIYNTVILFKIAGISPWWVLGYLAAAIPFVGVFVALGITIYAMINLAKAFGKSGAFAAGLVLLSTIFYCILGFGSAEYQGNKKEA